MTQQFQYWALYPEETTMQKHTCAPMFIASLCTIARTLKQPECPLTGERIKKIWYIHKQWTITQP